MAPALLAPLVSRLSPEACPASNWATADPAKPISKSIEQRILSIAFPPKLSCLDVRVGVFGLYAIHPLRAEGIPRGMLLPVKMSVGLPPIIRAHGSSVRSTPSSFLLLSHALYSA